jgi:UDP-glucuronate decarboxylase
VDDVVEAIRRLMRTPANFVGPVNLGNPNEFTILELAERVLRLTGSRSQLDFKPLPSDDPKRRQPDISQAKPILDWEPRIVLTKGLANTIEYFDRLLCSSPAPELGMPRLAAI